MTIPVAPGAPEAFPGAGDGRIALEHRVAVVGHRWIDGDDAEIDALVERALVGVWTAARGQATASTPVGCTVVTSLAEGADRIAARVALRAGARLEVVLPLPAEQYREDFASARSQQEFHTLLRQAARVTCADAADSRPQAYAEAARLMLARADVLLAVWDGQPARGRGGTAETVDQARRLGLPVCWLEVHPQVRQPGQAGGAPGTSGATGTPAAARLHDLPIDAMALDDDQFRLLDQVNRAAVPGRHQPQPPADYPSEGQFAQYAWPAFRRADYLAGRAQRWFRRANRVVYGLSALAVAIVAFQVIFRPQVPGIVWGEFAALAVVLASLVLARRAALLERWLSLRFLAERIRSLAFIADIGGPETLHVGDPSLPGDSQPRSWLRRALDELWLHAPDPTASVDLERLRARLLTEWVRPQRDYQLAVARRAAGRQHLFGRLALTLFAVSLVASVLHSTDWLHGESEPDWVAFVSLAVPAAAAAASGYAAQQEYARTRIRAGTMAARLTLAEGQLASAGTLTQLRQAAVALDLQVQGESAEWYAATHLHETEVP